MSKKVRFGSDTTWPKSSCFYRIQIFNTEIKYKVSLANIEVNSVFRPFSEAGFVSADMQPPLKIIIYFFPSVDTSAVTGAKGAPAARSSAASAASPGAAWRGSATSDPTLSLPRRRKACSVEEGPPKCPSSCGTRGTASGWCCLPRKAEENYYPYPCC